MYLYMTECMHNFPCIDLRNQETSDTLLKDLVLSADVRVEENIEISKCPINRSPNLKSGKTKGKM